MLQLSKSTFIAILFILITVLNLTAAEMLHISLGDNYGKHAMRINGEPAGIQKDLLDWFLKEYMALEIKIEAMPWKRAQKLVEVAKYSDGYFTAYTKKRVDVLKLVPSKKPFYTTSPKIHTWKGHPKMESFRRLSSVEKLLEMQDIRHVMLRGSGYHEELLKGLKKVHKSNSAKLIPKFLLELKRADLFIEQSELFYPLAEDVNLLGYIETLDNIKFKNLDWHLYIRPDSKHAGLMTKIDNAMDTAIEDGILLKKVREIFARYNLTYQE